MRAGGQGRHQDHVAGEHMEQRQRADDVVLLGEEQRMPDPTIIDHAGILVLRHLGHARCATGVEIGRHAVSGAVGEIQMIAPLTVQLSIEIQDARFMLHLEFRAQKWHDQLLQAGHVAKEINLQHGFHTRRKFDGF